MFVRDSPFHRGVKIIYRLNPSDAADVFVRRSISGMSHDLKNPSVAVSPFTADVERGYQWIRWIETQPMQNTSLN